MAKEKLIPWVIRNCDAGNFRDMWWHEEQPGVVCFEWTRQGNAGWLPPEAASEWARQKRNLRDKKPRDLKAGLRNALDKKKELVKCKFSKAIMEHDGRKFKFWKFKDLKTERENIKNPTSKGGQKKKTNKKGIQSQQDFKETQLSPCSSTSDFEDNYQKSEKTLYKGKRGERRKLSKAKIIENFKYKQSPKLQRGDDQENACSLPSIEAFFQGGMQGISPPPLQSQTISSTHKGDWFPDTSECWNTSQQLALSPGGPTPPPQPSDVELPGYFNFESAHHPSTQQWCPSPFGNLFPPNQVQNIPTQTDANFTPSTYMPTTSSYPQLATSTATHPCLRYPDTLNFQNMDETCAAPSSYIIQQLTSSTCLNLQDMAESCQENESQLRGSNPVLLQSDEVMDNVFLPNAFEEYQLFDAILNGLQLDNTITDIS